jgi:hypothetical protein
LEESAGIKERKTYEDKRLIFAELYYKAKKEMEEIRLGIHEIEVTKVLGIGMFRYPQLDVAIIKDTKDRLWIIPETEKLISRWDIKLGDKIKVKLEQTTDSFISSAVILK